ncbi:MAG: nitrile hydratase subunit beta [Betaproteobacteria bacterium]|nr:nitrile hydratase subunit beta [Betaproteobacteria bacterium]
MTSNSASKMEQTPSPDFFDSSDFKEMMRTVHDLGGEEGGPIRIEERVSKKWETSTFVTCECLAWRGVWNTVEKHRRHADLGQTQYLGLPYYGRWLVSAARVMLDKQHITLTELTNKIEEVKKRNEKR